MHHHPSSLPVDQPHPLVSCETRNTIFHSRTPIQSTIIIMVIDPIIHPKLANLGTIALNERREAVCDTDSEDKPPSINGCDIETLGRDKP